VSSLWSCADKCLSATHLSVHTRPQHTFIASAMSCSSFLALAWLLLVSARSLQDNNTNNSNALHPAATFGHSQGSCCTELLHILLPQPAPG
jgi:hypothetical protein